MPDHAILVDDYLQRIGHSGATPPTLTTLNALTRAHAQSIAFENVDVLLGRRIMLEPPALMHKLVGHKRGGYCFEQNGLFLAVLRQLGFAARPLGGRVRLGSKDRRQPHGRTHMLVLVELDGQPWISDVGVGATSLTQALKLEHGRVQETPHDTRRLQFEQGRWYHQIQRHGHWSDVYEFTLEDFAPVDQKVANWYTSTHPDSTFCQQLVAAIARPDGGRNTLKGAQLSLRQPGATAHQEALPDAAAVCAALEQHFGILLPPAEQPGWESITQGMRLGQLS